jgi:hypothetical protein
VIFLHAAPISRLVIAAATPGSITSLARSLFSDYLIAFEVTSVLLLAAVVGAIGLARRLPLAADLAERNGAEQTALRGASGTVERHEQKRTAIPVPAGHDRERRNRRSA